MTSVAALINCLIVLCGLGIVGQEPSQDPELVILAWHHYTHRHKNHNAGSIGDGMTWVRGDRLMAYAGCVCNGWHGRVMAETCRGGATSAEVCQECLMIRYVDAGDRQRDPVSNIQPCIQTRGAGCIRK